LHKERHNAFSNARMNAVFDSIRQGNSSPDELIKAAREAELDKIVEIRMKSEKRFKYYAKRLKAIKSFREADPLDDVYEGIDFWVSLDEKFNLPELPVQIKSSFKDVTAFKQGVPFERPKGIEIVTNTGPSTKFKGFNRQIFEEISRIKEILENRN